MATTATLTNANNYSGATAVAAGTLTLSAARAISNSVITYTGGTISETVDNGISDSAALIITGPSIEISHANNYTGGTTLNAGTLTVCNTTGSATGSGPVTLNGGELASDPGFITGTVIAGIGPHIITPGGDGTIGDLTVGGLILNSFSTLRFDITDAARFDHFIDLGSLGFSGTGTATIMLPDGLPNGTYPLLTFTSTTLADASDFILMGPTGPITSNYGLVLTGNALNLQVPGIPEPASLALVALGGVALLTRRRR